MNSLRQYIRRILLTEGMKTPKDLPNNVGVLINGYDGSLFVEITYCEIKEDGTRGRKLSMPNELSPVSGYMEITKLDGDLYYDCDGAYEIDSVQTASGYGPLLYDIAIEIASEYGSGLVADRGSVSQSAEKVWRFYQDNRGDVQKFQCDNEDNYLTPDEEDNLNQGVAQSVYDKGDEEGYSSPDKLAWLKSPLSKRYSKSKTIIPELETMGKLFIEGL